jgi:hypothetical protein
MNNLKELPPDHPQRNTPLREIGAEYRNIHRREWQSVAQWNIGVSTYNELGPVWTDHEWRALNTGERLENIER